MKKTVLTLLTALFTFGANAQNETRNYAHVVNPFIGTGGHGHTFPGASSPFGMVQLSPDTRKEGWDGCGGYHYTDTTIHGFSHTHLSGTGVPDYADLLILPLLGKHQIKADETYAIPFSHAHEKAHAGYYTNTFHNNKVKVELTTSNRTGFHRYTFPKDKQDKYLLLDLDYRDQLLDVEFNKVDKNHLSGKRISKAWAREQHFYFYLECNEDIAKIERVGKSNKYLIYFSPKTKELELKVGISAVDVAGAQKNLKAVDKSNFKTVKTQNETAWNKELNKIEIFTSNKSVDTIFYTALYHSFIAPNLFSDIDGRYRGTDLNIHQLKENEKQYTVFSLWDTFRGAHPLFALTQRERSVDFINTFLNQYQEGGKLPMWELSGNYTGCMIGYHAVPVIVDAYFKGIREFDHELALEAMISTANAKELGKDFYRTQGVIYQEDEAESVSKTLEYAYNDWCIARFAEALGKDEIAQEFYLRSLNYRNLFNPANKFMQPKTNGAFVANFIPSEVNFNYTEANSWQYSLFAPHDIEGLTQLLGGQQALEKWLDNLFSTSSDLAGRHQVDITGLIGQYAHGNEPSHHMAYLYNYAGKPEKTRQMLHKILKEQYSNAPDGLSGNEDCGQMSAWYVLNALGMYSVTPGASYYDLGLPLVDSARIHLENGNTLIITKTNDPKGQITWNGKKLTDLSIDAQTLQQGGRLQFAGLNTSLPAPNSQVHDENFLTNPVFEATQRVFQDSMRVKLMSTDDNPIYYSINNALNWNYYQDEFYIYEDTKIFAKSATKLGESKTVIATFHKDFNNYSYQLLTPYDNQYNGGNEQALMDGLKSGNNYRTGLYQGFEGKDVELLIDLDTLVNLERVEISFLQYINAWIFLPQQVEVDYLDANMKVIASDLVQVNDPALESEYNLEKKTTLALDKESTARYLKLKIKNYGSCPDWHLGSGGKTWIFMDEIEIFTK
ncbi:alpha-1,2-mannosidase, putative [Lishizhenia tianjinensis]|uniref:Alpha-1,2-mannosidase, putative n=1 Tax=Lishizhenia tianjinensis TaxID=477690 RepID=A0A1I6XYQ7_9FLAO|nr:GH92 family glycosyl hydrolase [Lishizhenia tianjinensis]SFT43172.1 alpha-1,2-mannosidase, putative [Lishizhenia tianjinensis]